MQDGYDSARRGHKLQAGLSGIIGEVFREMVKDRTYAALKSRAKEGRANGGRAYGYRDGATDKGEAFMGREMECYDRERVPPMQDRAAQAPGCGPFLVLRDRGA